MWNQANLTHLSQFNFAEDLLGYPTDLALMNQTLQYYVLVVGTEGQGASFS